MIDSPAPSDSQVSIFLDYSLVRGGEFSWIPTLAKLLGPPGLVEFFQELRARPF